SQLAAFGYSVSGWSRTEKFLQDVHCYFGEDGLDSLLEQSDIVVNILPLNASTQGILNAQVFNKMPEGSYLINCGRGDHLVEAD
ncbi:NAD(P)-dependent oxidoreductase, partial [Domibacillus sp. 8LH]|uniref:NAD(P)-dependent oxidoreductase n=1 Tax=Domibacillus sp. 8LH TaxID=3073900 RepID=UPI003171D00C